MWLPIVVVAHLLNASVFIVDKVMLGKTIKNPTVYAVIIGLLSAVVMLLLPLAPSIPSPMLLLEDIASGAALILALITFFGALKRLEASRLIPFVGAMIPLTTFIASFHVLGERLSLQEGIAFILLVGGGVFITLDPQHPNTKNTLKGWILAVASVIFFTASFVSMKHLFNNQAFWSAFIWSRLGSFLVAVILLGSGVLRREIVATIHRLPFKQAAAFLGNQALGAAAFILLNIAIKLAPSVTIVNALQSVQYVFVLLFAIIASLKRPTLLKERITPLIITEKVLAIILIAEGLYLL
ncbi:DMT family transporter [Candidatus Uhrbacteria bacterium]|nr:DMT family transporter [Candidatus Uhrbacteria bacterium]